MGNYYRTFTVVDLGAIKDNFLALKEKTDENVKLLAVIKADAYGHGAVPCAETLAEVADYFAVATVDEAVELRKAGVVKPILVLGYCEHESFYNIIEYDITAAVFRYFDAYLLNILAAKAGKTVKVHLAVDTGMGRIGFRCTGDDIKDANKIFELSNIRVEGVFSHFACADEEDNDFTDKQSEQFESFISSLRYSDRIEIMHHCNSAGIMLYKKYNRDMVRAGISMYGYMPDSNMKYNDIKLKPALSWYSHVTNIKTVNAGDGISYGQTFVADKPTKVATVSIGYADGYNRLLSNKGRVIINGCYANILGRVCMDQIMVDITDIPDVEIENIVTLIGREGDCQITADDMAAICGTISYEILCNISKRVVRTFLVGEGTEEDFEELPEEN